MINVMGNRNLIILGGSALLILMFVTYMMGVNNRAKLMPQSTQSQQKGYQTTPQGAEQMNVMLSPQGNSSESGIATLKEINGRATVNLFLTGYAPDVSQPAHIHAGTCPGVGAINYPLNSVVNGRSITLLNVSLAQLMQQLPLVINVHKSNTEISTYTSCGSL